MVKRKVPKKHDDGPKSTSARGQQDGHGASHTASLPTEVPGLDKIPGGGGSKDGDVGQEGTPTEFKEPPEESKPEHTLQPVKSEHGTIVDKTIDVLVSMGYKHDEAEQATLKVFNNNSCASGPNANNLDEIMDLIEATRSGKIQETDATAVPPSGPEATPSEGSTALQEEALATDPEVDPSDNDHARYWQPNSWDSYGWGSCWNSYYDGWWGDESRYKRSWSTWSAETTPSHAGGTPSSSHIQAAMDRLNTQEIEQADPHSAVVDDFQRDLAKELERESLLEDLH